MRAGWWKKAGEWRGELRARCGIYAGEVARGYAVGVEWGFAAVVGE